MGGCQWAVGDFFYNLFTRLLDVVCFFFSASVWFWSAFGTPGDIGAGGCALSFLRAQAGTREWAR